MSDADRGISLSRSLTDAPELLVGVDVDETFLAFGRSQIQNSIDLSSAVPTLLRASLPTIAVCRRIF